MTAPIAAPSTPASSPASSANASGMPNHGAAGLLSSGLSLFGHLLSMGKSDGHPAQSQALAHTDLPEQALIKQKPTVVQNFIALNPDALSAVLARLNQSQLSHISPEILAALTAGTPSSQPMLPETGSGTPAPLPPLTANGDKLETADALLSTIGLFPSEIEDLQSAIQSLEEDVALAENEPALDLEELSCSPVFVFMAAPLTAQPVMVNTEAAEMDFISISSFSNAPLSDTTESDWIEKQLARGGTGFGSLFTDGDGTDALYAGTQENGIARKLGALSSTQQVDMAAQKNSKGTSTSADLTALSTSSGLSAFPSGLSASMTDAGLMPPQDGLLSVQAPQNNASSSYVLSTASASAGHPASQAVAMLIEKSVSGSDKAKQELSVQLDPPELGRLQIQLSMEKGESMKVHLTVEKPETLALLQRDSYILKTALDNAGIQTDTSSLSFDLAHDNNSFNQMMGQSEGDSKGRGARYYLSQNGDVSNSSEMRILETRMDFLADKVTGHIRYSLIA